MAKKLDTTFENVTKAVLLAKAAGDCASTYYLENDLGGEDQYPCGFAWIVANVKGSTKVGKALLKNGFRTSYGVKGLQMWNPGGVGVQNANCLYAGAQAAASMLREKLGIEVYADTRWD